MGQSYAKNEYKSSGTVNKRSQIHLEQQNWELLQKPDVDKQQMGSFGIYKNTVTGEVARKYDLIMEKREALKQYVEQFDFWRSQMRQNVIESKYILFEEESFGFSQLCNKYFPVKIFVQNPVVTLAEIKDIPVSEGLYIIFSSLVGFQHLFEVFGYFALTQSMITINQHGGVKTWIHPNLSSNRPSIIGLNDIQPYDIECPDRFIKQLIEMIDNNIDYEEIDVKFSNFINKKYQNKKVLSFVNCRKQLLNYAQQFQIDLPDSLLTILDLLFDKSNRTSISQQNLSGKNAPVLYGKNYENRYLLGQDSDNDNDQKFNELQNVQSPSQNSQFPHRSPSDQIGSFYPQQNGMQRAKNSTQQLSAQSQNNNQRNLPRNYSYNDYINIPNDFNIIYQNENHRKSFPIQNFILQQNIVSQNQNNKDFTTNPYNSLIQLQNIEKQSTIRQEVEQDSFLTSYKNGRFQSSKDGKRGSNHLKKYQKNIPTHRHTLSSQSNSRMNTQNIGNSSPRQIKIKEQTSNNVNLNSSEQSMTKKSQKSFQFHTLHEVKQLDVQIAQDLQKMLKKSLQ